MVFFGEEFGGKDFADFVVFNQVADFRHGFAQDPAGPVPNRLGGDKKSVGGGAGVADEHNFFLDKFDG